ncbi:MAG: alpha/beta hydrolase [Actinobacteria bacterium]|nr:alpha/beta hydrolase [Actinomycetota bacterium]
MTDAKPPIAGFEERSLDHAGSRIGYLVGGAGPPILLLHGLGGAASNWLLVARELARTHRVVVPELPGHGRSERLAAAPSLDPFAAAMLAVAEAEDAVPSPWVGHSLGGLVAMRAAVLRPDAVTRLVLAAAAGISSATRIGRATVTVIGLVEPGKLIGRRRRAVARSRLGRTLTFWWGVADPHGLAPEAAEAFLAGPPQHTDLVAAGKALVASDTREDLHRVTCPVLFLWGANDTWVPLADGMEYARRLRAPIRIVADCGHLLIGERPDAIVRAIDEFV